MTAAESPGLDLIVVGGSWGGLDATCRLLAEIPSPAPVPIVVVLHRARTSDPRSIQAVIRRCCDHRLLEADDKSPLEAGVVLVAPPDYHLLVEGSVVSLSTDAPVNFTRPSVDVTFESAADVCAERLAVVVLTGLGRDGANGMAYARKRGALTLVQDPASAEREDMPVSALATGRADHVGTPEELGRRLAALVAPARGGDA